MALENVRKFDEKLKGDEALQARLKELTEAFDGDRQDSRALFEAVVIPLAAEVGLPYTYDEILEAQDQDDDEDLTADEAKAMTGGINSICFFIGGGDVAANSCSAGEWGGANACAGIGVGFSTI